MNLPDKVRIVEVCPRDGLQVETLPDISLEDKIEFVNMLSGTGLKNIEAGSFVSPKWVPKMANTSEVFKGITKIPSVTYSALVPNLAGFEKALEAGVDEVVIFGSASETFAQKNINCTIDDSLEKFSAVVEKAMANDLPVRGDIACALGCQYEGPVDPGEVARIARELYHMGCYEICLADTLGTGNPVTTVSLIESVRTFVPIDSIAFHFHDTFGLGLTNIFAAMQEGIRIFDSAAGGLGGCPYMTDAGGNVSTEDLVNMLHSLNIETGIDQDKIISVGNFICDKLGVRNSSRTANAKPGIKNESP